MSSTKDAGYSLEELGGAIDLYISESKPAQAIYLDGEWGIGKTHFIKSREAGWVDKSVIYISLFGLSTLSEIEDAIVAKRLSIGKVLISEGFGKMAGEGLQLVGSDQIEKASGILGTLASAATKWVKKGVVDSVGDSSVIILDDLERYKGRPSEVLSLCNRLTEHQGAHVILIGCQTELERDDKYDRYAEKALKNTYVLNRDASDVAEIVASLFSEKKEFYEFINTKISGEIIGVIDVLGCKNIRILSSALSNIYTIYKGFSKDFELHSDKAARLCRECFLITIAFKWYLAKARGDLRRGLEGSYTFNEPTLDESADQETKRRFKRFFSAGLFSGGLSHKSLVRLVADGIYPAQELRQEILLWEPKDCPLPERMQLIYDESYEAADEVVEAVIQGLEKKDIQFSSLMQLIDIYCRVFSVQEIGAFDIEKEKLFSIVDDHFKFSLSNYGNVIKGGNIYRSVDVDVLRMYVSQHEKREYLTKVVESLSEVGRSLAQVELAREVEELLQREPVKGIESINDGLDGIPIFHRLDMNVLENIFTNLDGGVSAALSKMLMRRYGSGLNRRCIEIEAAAFLELKNRVEPRLNLRNLRAFHRKRAITIIDDALRNCGKLN